MKGKFILVTGASGGIGQATAYKLAEEGYSLYLHYNKNEQEINNLLKRIEPFHGEYIPIQADLTDKDSYKKIADQVFSIEGIVHNSGTGHYGLFLDLDETILENLMKIHVTAPLLLTKTLLPKMLQQQSGKIIMISSIWGQTGAACEVAYSTAKGAQIAFVKALSKELALNGITVNCIAPGAVETTMMQQFSEEEIDMIKGDIPMGRLALASEIAESVSFLLSKRSSYITGQTLGVNGGWYM